MKKIIWVIIIIIILVLGAAGYGFSGGIKTKNFAKEAEKIFNNSQGKWKVSDLTSPPAAIENDSSKLKTFYNDILNDCNSASSQIDNLGQTRKTKDLKTNLDRYYFLNKKASENAIIIVDYLIEMEKIQKEITFSASGTSPEAVVKELEEYKTSIDSHRSTLKTIKTTPSIKSMNDAFVKALEEMSTYLGQAITAMNAGDLNALNTLSTNLASTMKSMEKTKMPSESEMKNDILSSSEESEINSLVSKIQGEITDLKKVVFAY